MGDANCMIRSAEVAATQDACLVVVSATSGTTNDLIALARTAEKQSWAEAEALVQKIVKRHHQIGDDLKIPASSLAKIDQLLEEMESLSRGINLLKDCSVKAMDTMMSLGERLSSVLFTEAMNQVLKKQNPKLKAELLDVRAVLRTDDQFSKARPQTEDIMRLCAEKTSRDEI